MRPDEFSSTWWGRRWTKALESLNTTYPNSRLPRARTLARNDAVADIKVIPGRVRASVAHGKRTLPVELTLPVFSDDAWAAATEQLAARLRPAAQLLDGQMPTDMEELLARVDLPLFPQRGELVSACPCADSHDPCVHASAVHYALSPIVDRDPFLLLTLRGRARSALLEQLRAHRSGYDTDTGSAAAGTPVDSLDPATFFDSPGDLSAIRPARHRAPDPTAVVRRLGDVPGFTDADHEALHNALRQAAARARRTAAAGT
jgi:uncharacterized Zn finger protein